MTDNKQLNFKLARDKANLFVENLSVGTKLTVDNDIVSVSGTISFRKGDIVTIREIVSHVIKHASVYGCEAKSISGVKLEGKYGIYFLSMFTETKDCSPDLHVYNIL